jgi:hypothetical protein
MMSAIFSVTIYLHQTSAEMTKGEPLNVPVAMMVFNRPEQTQRVFERVRAARPAKLLAVADGPRPERAGESELCSRTREIFQTVDWDCNLSTNFSPDNLGCRKRISSGLTWVFEQVEEAIILEDDCLPDPSFFAFCQELLARYRNDLRIMAISGDNFQVGRKRTTDSYYFSRHIHVWGWASWRRAWTRYDEQMRKWPELRDGGWLEDILGDHRAAAWWSRMYQDVYEGKIDTWDYQWQLAIWAQHGLVVLPNQNLVSNIGFTAQATHTANDSPLAELPTTPLDFPLQHPAWVIRDAVADATTQDKLYSPSLSRRIARRLRRLPGQYGFINGNQPRD